MSRIEGGAEILRVSGLHKWFGAHHVLRGIDLAVRQGEHVRSLRAPGS